MFWKPWQMDTGAYPGFQETRLRLPGCFRLCRTGIVRLVEMSPVASVRLPLVGFSSIMREYTGAALA
jgi:hypothetical protein